MTRDDAVRAAAEALAAHDVKGHGPAARLAAARLAVDAAAPHLTADLVRERDEALAEIERRRCGMTWGLVFGRGDCHPCYPQASVDDHSWSDDGVCVDCGAEWDEVTS